MTTQELVGYKEYIFRMTDDELDNETQAVIKQDASVDKSILIQYVYTEWLNRGKGERFVKSYNKGVS